MTTRVMGILNVTPDSFFDGGQLYTDGKVNLELVKNKVSKMLEDGADIIDVGGESTRPGCEPVDVGDELQRVIPVVTMIKSTFNIPISVDTYKSVVARAAIEAGADMINDIGMMEKDPDMIKVIASSNVKYVLTHNKESYVNLKEELLEVAKSIESQGVKKENIILDPGIGFNKTYEDSLREIAQIDLLCKTGYPVLLGASRKSFIREALMEIGDTTPEQRLNGTLATTVWAVMSGVSYVRVHDIKENKEAICVAQAILNRK